MATIALTIEDEALRNAVLDLLTASLNVGTGAATGSLDVLDVDGEILATYLLSNPASAASSGSVATFNAITTPAAALESGNADSFRMKDRDGNPKISGSAGLTGCALNLESVAFVADEQPEDILSFSIAMPVPPEAN